MNSSELGRLSHLLALSVWSRIDIEISLVNWNDKKQIDVNIYVNFHDLSCIFEPFLTVSPLIHRIRIPAHSR